MGLFAFVLVRFDGWIWIFSDVCMSGVYYALYSLFVYVFLFKFVSLVDVLV